MLAVMLLPILAAPPLPAEVAEAAPIVDSALEGPWTVPVVEVRFFPRRGQHVDIAVTGDWGAPIDETRTRVERMNETIVRTLEDGSRFRGYSDATARPSVRYQIVKTYEFLEPLPTRDVGGKTPLTDYRAIMARVDTEYWVTRRQVKEFWIWAYHGDKVTLWESNMAGPHGDVSNSNRDPDDLPIFDRTYTVYHYNYQRSAHMAVHNHVHQMEHLLNHVDGRHLTPKDQWSTLLFWGRFVGSDASHRLRTPIGAGWCHYPPNAQKDYDYLNPRFVESDAEDWNPQRTGKRIRMNCQHWGCDDLAFYRWWFQSLPGAGHRLSHDGRRLHNWWLFKGDWDTAMARGLSLTMPPRDPTTTAPARRPDRR